jgi:uncharacterized integral membrane protein
MRRLRNWVLFTLGALIGLATALFIAENRSDIVVEFVAWESEALPLWFVLSIAFVAGAVVPRLMTAGASYRRMRQHLKLKKRLGDLEAEVVRLRNIPLEALPEKPDVAEPAPTRAAATNLPTRGRDDDEDYEAFLLDDAGEQEFLPAPARPVGQDPYADLFDASESPMSEADEAQLYPAVIDADANGS